MKTPIWLTPLDAFKQQALTDWKYIRTYKDFLQTDGTLKSNQDLERSQITLT